MENLNDSLNNMLEDLENSKISTGEIHNQLKNTFKDVENLTLEVEAEIIAFYLKESSEKTGLGYHFSSVITYQNDKGEIFDSVISELNQELINYWEKRIKQTNNPILKSRYSGLVFEFKYPITKEKTNREIAEIYIKSMIEIVKKRLCKYNFQLIMKIERALNISIKYNFEELVEILKKEIINLEEEIIDTETIPYSGFSLEFIAKNKKFNFSNDDEKYLLEKLTSYYFKLVNKKDVDPQKLEKLAISLADYYRKNNNPKLVKEIILNLGKSLQKYEKKLNILQKTYRLEYIIETYRNYGFINESNEILTKLEKLSSKTPQELTKFEQKVEIPKEEMDEYINYFTTGNPEEILYRIAFNFIPKKDEVIDRINKLSKEAPFSYLFKKQLIDDKGIVMAKIGSLEEDFEGNIIQEISNSLTYQKIVIRFIFDKIRNNNLVKKEDIIDFLSKSPIFSKDNLKIIDAGLDSYFNGDLISAINNVVPQIEALIRNLFKIIGKSTLKINDYEGFHYKGLGDLLREDIFSEIFGEDVYKYFIVLLADSRGWNIRNRISHGLFRENLFNHDIADRLVHVLLILGCLREKN